MGFCPAGCQVLWAVHFWCHLYYWRFPDRHACPPWSLANPLADRQPFGFACDTFHSSASLLLLVLMPSACLPVPISIHCQPHPMQCVWGHTSVPSGGLCLILAESLSSLFPVHRLHGLSRPTSESFSRIRIQKTGISS